MRKVLRGDLLDLAAYEQIRPHFGGRVIEEKKRRRFQPSAELSVVFENTDTVLFQIQEMLRTKRIIAESGIARDRDVQRARPRGRRAVPDVVRGDPRSRDARPAPDRAGWVGERGGAGICR
jgi:hypothetical protein